MRPSLDALLRREPGSVYKSGRATMCGGGLAVSADVRGDGCHHVRLVERNRVPGNYSSRAMCAQTSRSITIQPKDERNGSL